MKEDSYVVIQAFMVNELGLKGNELIVYATIYGFTQDGEHWFYGTKGYLAEWCGATKGTVGNCLKSLIDKGLIERRERVEHCQLRIEYRATKNLTPPTKNCTTPRIKIDPINNLEVQPSDKPIDKWKAPTVDEVAEYVREKGYHFDPKHFHDYYEASGWRMQSGKRVKSWKQCCVTWERNHKGDEPSGQGEFDVERYNYF